MASLTRDDPADREGEALIFARGFAHPRLWEHYAEGHRGVCLCFDQEALVRSAISDIREQGELQHGPLTYVDAALARKAREVVSAGVRGQPGALTLEEHLAQHAHEIFFTKLKDWETEWEYRFVFVTGHDDPVPIPIHRALNAIIIGASVDLVYLPTIRKACEQKEVPIYRITWPYGYPRLDLQRP